MPDETCTRCGAYVDANDRHGLETHVIAVFRARGYTATLDVLSRLHGQFWDNYTGERRAFG